ncbi:D-alanyl-D-alanine carboxypeptidase [Roseivivax lentus]|uniref:D-alanyl-D-alanine carboxypeptidase n=1 Tax=Roseivivax lentus TaxID=633194 RepID=A0A1N7NT82_9RHOB|nr:serine hydrolase domain-containing protein [Roseivivax lentus]SIT01573.1 D-alanyl-D-alanine carboxypeptidase [Roseivivax lentus]
MRPGVGSVVIAALWAIAAPVAADTLQTRLQGVLAGFHEKYGFPGVTAAIASPGGPVVTAAIGFSDLEARRPMTPDTPMLAASIGKTFVAVTVLALEDEGLLSLTDPVSKHLGHRDWVARLPNHATMTVQDLLRHTSGLPDHVHIASFQADMGMRMASGGAAIGPEEAIAFVLDAEPLFPAGSGWAYTDTGYLLLGLVIEKVSGDGFFDLVTARFLDPLGLDNTAPADRPDLPGVAIGYVAQNNPFGLPERTADADGRLLWDPGMEWTGGGFLSTSRDLARWGQALFGGEALEGPYLDRVLDGVPVSPEAPGVLYGAGVAIHSDTPRGPVYGHGGWIPGYVSSLRHYADHSVTVAFQINTDVGIADDDTDLVPALEAALADLAIGNADGGENR